MSPEDCGSRRSPPTSVRESLGITRTGKGRKTAVFPLKSLLGVEAWVGRSGKKNCRALGGRLDCLFYFPCQSAKIPPWARHAETGHRSGRRRRNGQTARGELAAPG